MKYGCVMTDPIEYKGGSYRRIGNLMKIYTSHENPKFPTGFQFEMDKAVFTKIDDKILITVPVVGWVTAAQYGHPVTKLIQLRYDSKLGIVSDTHGAYNYINKTYTAVATGKVNFCAIVTSKGANSFYLLKNKSVRVGEVGTFNGEYSLCTEFPVSAGDILTIPEFDNLEVLSYTLQLSHVENTKDFDSRSKYKIEGQFTITSPGTYMIGNEKIQIHTGSSVTIYVDQPVRADGRADFPIKLLRE